MYLKLFSPFQAGYSYGTKQEVETEVSQAALSNTQRFGYEKEWPD